MFLADYHIHTAFSSDSTEPMENQILAAIDNNLDEIAFTDHVDFDDRYDYTNYNEYMPYLNALQEKYSNKIKIILGVEVGLENTKADIINAFTSSFPFDFIIGSSHGVCNKDLFFDREIFFEGKTKKEAYNIYFSEMLKNISTCNHFCVYGHLDFVSRYGTYDDNSLKYLDYKEHIDAVLCKLISLNKGIEINTSGFRYGINQAYPQIDILKAYKDLGGEIVTVGSDAHFSKDVAHKLDIAYGMLKEVGLEYITTFKNLKPNFIKI